MNALLMVSDGLQTRVGTLTAGTEWFKSWRTIDGEEEPDLQLTELQVMLEGVCAPDRFLILLRDFMAFEDDGSGKLAHCLTQIVTLRKWLPQLICYRKICRQQ